MNLLTCFKILELPSDADAEQAKRAYKAQVRRWHPDQFPEDSAAKAGAEEQLKQINVAYARIKKHLASLPPTGYAQKSASSSRPGNVDNKSTKKTKTEKPTWFDALFKTINTVFGERRSPSYSPSSDDNRTQHQPSFGQVLDEMAGGSVAAQKKRRKRRSDTVHQHSAYGRRRGGSSVNAVGSAPQPGPVRPVGRVRGIGKPR